VNTRQRGWTVEEDQEMVRMVIVRQRRYPREQFYASIAAVAEVLGRTRGAVTVRWKIMKVVRAHLRWWEERDLSQSQAACGWSAPTGPDGESTGHSQPEKSPKNPVDGDA
jgi:hypothetical protein